jgi:alcohol dehydrogenase (nicotinoprotein)
MKSNIATAVDELVMSTATNPGACRAGTTVVTAAGVYDMGWTAAAVKLTELITRKYALDEINEGYQDLMDGKNIRGVIIHEH